MTAMTWIDVVDLALDRLVKKGKYQFRTAALAKLVNVTRPEMSTAVQVYRGRQQRHTTRYVIASSGYGRAAMWDILAIPNGDPAAMQQARVEHLRWSARDAAQRWARDVVCELEPGLKGKRRDAVIASITPFITAQHEAISAFVRQQLNALP